MQPQKYWREIPRRYRLEAGKCRKCGKVFMPGRLICDACKSREFDTVRLPAAGSIYTYTVVRVPPSGFASQAPYVLAIVELDGGSPVSADLSGAGSPGPLRGVKLTMQITDCNPEDVKIGSKVKLEFRKINEVGKAGVICYGYKGVLQ